jgi:uncharacterized protein (TIGR03032 family)
MSPPPPNAGVRVECNASEAFRAWMADAGGSLIVTTYQAHRVALLGWNGTQINLLLRQFEKPMGLAVTGRRLALATRNAIWFFADAPLLAHDFLEGQPGKYDAVFLPRRLTITGDMNFHDLAMGPDRLWLVNTRFSCLASLSDEYNFVPHWHPPWVTQVVPEDRCHLNGLALVDGQPRYVTALGETDEPGTWRANKAAGGVLVDVTTNQVVVRGLSMPHSPRWHDGKLWVLNSGAGELCQVNVGTGKPSVICTLPGYLRGLCFVGPYAVIGLCCIREKHIFGGLPVQQRFPSLRCGIAVVDLRTGNEAGLFEFTAGCHEIYDVQYLPGIYRGNIVNLEMPEAFQACSAPDFAYWLRPSSEIPLDKP